MCDTWQPTAKWQLLVAHVQAITELMSVRRLTQRATGVSTAMRQEMFPGIGCARSSWMPARGWNGPTQRIPTNTSPQKNPGHGSRGTPVKGQLNMGSHQAKESGKAKVSTGANPAIGYCDDGWQTCSCRQNLQQATLDKFQPRMPSETWGDGNTNGQCNEMVCPQLIVQSKKCHCYKSSNKTQISP